MPPPFRESGRDCGAESRLAEALGPGRFGRPLHAFERVPSTMDVAARLAEQGEPEGTLVWARRQERGRGRLGRAWASPEGGIYLSLIVRPPVPVSRRAQLSLVAGVAVAEAIHEVTRLGPQIRWPNDLLLDGRKVAGILVEGKGDAAIVGIGINVGRDARALPEHAISLAAHGPACDPYRLAGTLCGRFEAWYDAWISEGFRPIRHELRRWIGLFGGLVRLTRGSEEIEGQALDVDEDGRLLVRCDSGLVRAFEMGDVSLL